MAQLTKADLSNLSTDTSVLINETTDFLTPYVAYDQEMLTKTFDLYKDNNSGLAMHLAGTTDKKSKQYKAALRSVEIWKKTGKGPGKPAKNRTNYRQRIVTILSRHDQLSTDTLIAASNRVGGVVTVSLTGVMTISQTPPEYRTFHANLSGDQLQAFLTYVVNGDVQSALDVYATAGLYPEFSLRSNDTHPIIVRFS